MNLTDSEIIQALECLHKRILHSKFAEDVTEKEIMALVEVADLINIKDVSIEVFKKDLEYQKAEIERWRANYTLPKEGFFNVLCGALVYTKTLEEYNQFRRTIKSEAIKEFADKLCKNRESEDLVVIAVNAELKQMEEND